MVIGKSELGRQKSRSQAVVSSCSIVLRLLRCDWRVLLWSDVSSLVCGLFAVLSGLFFTQGLCRTSRAVTTECRRREEGNELT